MSPKYALIFALAALCCLAVTEVSAQRRHQVDQTDDKKTVEAEKRQPHTEELHTEELHTDELDTEEKEQEKEKEGNRVQAKQGGVQSNEHRHTVDNGNKRETVIRSSNDDVRARRVVRRGRRRGTRRNRSNRRRRGGRRRGNRKNRSGNRRSVIRRRGGAALRG